MGQVAYGMLHRQTYCEIFTQDAMFCIHIPDCGPGDLVRDYFT